MSSFTADLIANDILIDRADFCRHICSAATSKLVNAIAQLIQDTVSDDSDDETDEPIYRVSSEILVICGIRSSMDMATQAAIFIDHGLRVGRDIQLGPRILVSTMGWFKIQQHRSIRPIVEAIDAYGDYRRTLIAKRLELKQAELQRERARFEQERAEFQREQAALQRERADYVRDRQRFDDWITLGQIRVLSSGSPLSQTTVEAIEALMMNFSELGNAEREQAEAILTTVRARID